MLEVDHRHGHEHGAEERSYCCPCGQPEGKHTAGKKQGCDELDGRIEKRDSCLTVAAAAAEQEIREEWNVVVPGDLPVARHAGRGWPDDRPPQRHSRGDDVQKAPEREARGEYDYCQGEIHLLSIGSLSP